MLEMRVQLNIWTKATRRFVMEIYKSFCEKSDKKRFLLNFVDEKSSDEGFWNEGIYGFFWVEIFWRSSNLKIF